MQRGPAPRQLFVRTLTDNEEALLPMRPAPQQDSEGWRAFRAFVPWDTGNDVTCYAFRGVDDGGCAWLAADGEHAQVPPLASHFRVNRLHAPPDNPTLGGDAALAQLRAATAARGMRLVPDAVVNHTGAQHPWFNRGC